jgi:propionyl-CoA carboxylase alpha chain
MPQVAAKYRHHMKEKPKLDLSKIVLSPMPGVIKSVAVEVGQVIFLISDFLILLSNFFNESIELLEISSIVMSDKRLFVDMKLTFIFQLKQA